MYHYYVCLFFKYFILVWVGKHIIYFYFSVKITFLLQNYKWLLKIFLILSYEVFLTSSVTKNINLTYCWQSHFITLFLSKIMKDSFEFWCNNQDVLIAYPVFSLHRMHACFLLLLGTTFHESWGCLPSSNFLKINILFSSSPSTSFKSFVGCWGNKFWGYNNLQSTKGIFLTLPESHYVTLWLKSLSLVMNATHKKQLVP